MSTAPKSASVELQGVSKSFDGTSVVRDLDLLIADGEFLVWLVLRAAAKAPRFA